MNKKIYKTIIILINLVIVMSTITNVYAADELSVNANASLIVETNSGKIIYEDNAETQNYPASLTKILTAILVLENCELDDIVTVSKSAVSNIPPSYVVAPLFVGEQMRVEDLLYALLLKSSNDAAYVLAEHVGGSVEGFSDMMNKKAEELGCKNTHFVNPNGIHNNEHYTTAYDMYLISKYAMENEEFVKIVSTYQYTLPATNRYSNSDRVMKNTNEFVNPNSKYYDENAKGIKTGTTLEAGNCLITDIEKNNFDVIVVVLGAKTRESKFSETSKMMNYMFDNYTTTEVHKKGDIIKNIDVDKATENTKNLNIIISDDISVINNVDIDVSSIEPEIILNQDIVAPISEGQELGIIKYTVDGMEYEAKLVAEKNVERKFENDKMLIGCVEIFIIFCLILCALKKKKIKNKK